MSKTFKIILSIASVLAFILLFICAQAEMDSSETYILLPILVIAAIGALRIIWKNEPKK